MSTGSDAGAILILILFGLYFLPSIGAWRWKHQHTFAIFVLNFFGGWTVLGWLVALVSAATAVKTEGPS